jgi:hypothetical protein
MTVDDLKQHYGTQAAAADAINVSRQAVSLWGDKGIPLEYQVEWEVATSGKLRADLPAIVRESAA